MGEKSLILLIVEELAVPLVMNKCKDEDCWGCLLGEEEEDEGGAESSNDGNDAKCNDIHISC